MGALDVDAADYKAFAQRLKAADRKVASALRARVRDAGKPLAEGVIADGPEGMPRRGGLADWLREAKGTLSMTQTRVAIRISRGGTHDLAAINAGRLRHPVYGSRRNWVSQDVPAGTYDAAIDKHAETALDDIARALEGVMEEL